MDKRLALVKRLEKEDPKKLNLLIGFDGFIDEIVHVVDKRLDSENYSRIETISALAKRIGRASGLSTNIELVPITKKIGGNGPIMANAMARHNPKLTYIGALGMPLIDEVYADLQEHAALITLAQSGHTDALEFDDGKLLLGKTASLSEITYDNLIENVEKDRLIDLLSEADLFASVNWSMITNMTDIWRRMVQNILPLLKPRKKRPVFFVDLADPEKRKPQEIIEALELLKDFKSHFYVILGLNKKEAYDVGAILPVEITEASSLEELNRALYGYLDIDAVVIHPVDASTCVVNGNFYKEKGPFVKKPKLTTGAGDNFNAGFVLGILLGLDPDQSLLVGMATSGYYVRQAKGPNYHELLAFIEEWANDRV
jgi:sugar/nucleoside kinase (ribokinase family)